MTVERVRMPCPKCGEEILLHQRRAMLVDFEVGCPNCKKILHTADLMKNLRRTANETQSLTAAKRSSKGRRSAKT
jgi:ssDNA-binding Zn-finger/Zn-ribbon topoisomerase 1